MLVRPASPASRAIFARVDHVQLDPLGEDLLLDRARQRVPHPIRRVLAVEQQRRARRGPVEHLGALEQPELVAADEAGLRDEVRRADRLRPEAQVRDGLRAGLLGVVDEVALGVQALFGAEDLDRVLVRADRAVGAEAEEHRPHGLRRLDVERRVVGQARAGDVVVDPDREPPLGPLALQLVEHAGDHPGRELLRGQAVAAADHARHQLALAVGVRLAERREHVEEQRLAERARAPWSGRARRPAARSRAAPATSVGGGERPVQPDLRHPDPLAARLQERHGLARGLPARAHHHEHPLGLGMPAVVDQPVVAAGALAELVHRVLHDARARGRRTG